MTASETISGAHNHGHDTTSSSGTDNAKYDPKDDPVENFRRMKVIAIGAGFSGIYMGIRIPEWLRNVELVVYEKNDGLGGTWWENRYPGCACDIPGTSLVTPKNFRPEILSPF